MRKCKRVYKITDEKSLLIYRLALISQFWKHLYH